ncbi:hypothetical protein KCU77_g7708, partial [Aureobasidium melanogenum]
MTLGRELLGNESPQSRQADKHHSVQVQVQVQVHLHPFTLDPFAETPTPSSMGVSIIDAQRDIILNVIRSTTQGQWKVLVLDDTSKKLLDNVLHPDDILNESITNIEKIEDR